MNTIAHYWTLVRLDPAGCSRVDELPAVREFFQQQVDSTLEQDILIQKQLMNLIQSSEKSSDRTLAELCLRCFISHHIEQACIQLETQFGEYYGFTRYNLFVYVLDDDGKGKRQKTESIDWEHTEEYQPLAVQVLQKFDLDRASLATWTIRLVKQHHELNAFLLEQGLCMLSDWAILNDTKPKKLQRVLTQFHQLTEPEVQQALTFLESYHTVYRRDRILQGQKGACPDPTTAQLQEMSDRIQQQTARAVSTDTILIRLTALATRLRQYRISIGGGKPPSRSLDQPDTTILDKLSQDATHSVDEDPQIEFLQAYRQQFMGCLENALQQVVSDRLQTLKPPKQQHFLMALQLFHCQKLVMSAIAQQIGLKAQFQVSRLLKLDELRTDVRHWMLQCLRNAVQNTVINYVEPAKLDKIDHQIAVALEEQIDDLIQKIRQAPKLQKAMFQTVYLPRSFANTWTRYQLHEVVMNSVNISDYLETLPSRAIALTIDQIDQAIQRSRAAADSTQQWQTYLKILSLLGFEQWLNQRASDVSMNQSQNSIEQSSVSLSVVCNLEINDFRVCLIPVESQPDQVEIPSIAIASPELAAHFYVAVAVYEEQSQVAVHSFLRHDQLTAQLQLLQPDADNLYSIPINTFEHDFDRLLLYLRCSEPSAIPLSTNSLTANSLSSMPDRVVQLTAKTINVRRWLQNELDVLAQQLSWVLLPPTALENAMRLTVRVGNQPTPQEGFEGVVKQLVRKGMTLPTNARVAYQDLDIGTVAARLYAIAGTLPANEHPPEWTLLIVLGRRSHTPLPRDIQLQISESAAVLVQQTLNPPDAYLYAKVIGTLEEQFSVTITAPDNDTLTLPAFAFQANH